MNSTPSLSSFSAASGSWTTIRNADGDYNPLYERYWASLFEFASKNTRRLPGLRSPEDMVQDFIVHMMEHDFFRKAMAWRNADPARKGLRFRQYLLKSFSNYILSKSRGKKTVDFVSLENLDYVPQPEEESRFDKHWAQAVIGLAMRRFVELCRAQGQESRAQIFLDRFGAKHLSYAQITQKHGLFTVTKTTYQLRKARIEFRECVRQVLQDEAFDDAADIKQLMRDLESSASSAGSDS